jgi:methanogenic corrinoid protein MtbC1
MSFEPRLIETTLSRSYLQTLMAGNRLAARTVVEDALNCGLEPHVLLNQLIWPTMELLQELYKDDRINQAVFNMATRLNRSITDNLIGQLTRKEENGKKVLILCGDDEPEELGGQICADLFEADGWTVKFAGGGVPEDEVLGLIGQERPDLVCMFATLPSGVPSVRRLIDYLREVNSCPNMQVMCCGGIYKRAEGLSEEIGADLYAPDAATAVQVANDHPGRRASVEQQTVGRTRRIRKAEARKASTGAVVEASATEPMVTPEAA